MGFVVIGLLLINVAGIFYLARAIRGLRDLVIERSLAGAELSAGLSKLVLDQVVDAVMQSKIIRSYLVEILERRILPTIGWKEKPKTEIEKFMLQVWQDEVIDRETTPETSDKLIFGGQPSRARSSVDACPNLEIDE